MSESRWIHMTPRQVEKLALLAQALEVPVELLALPQGLVRAAFATSPSATVVDIAVTGFVVSPTDGGPG